MQDIFIFPDGRPLTSHGHLLLLLLLLMLLYLLRH